MGKVDCNGGLVMVVLNRLKYCGKYKGKLSDVRPSYVYRGLFLGFAWNYLDFLGPNSRASCARGRQRPKAGLYFTASTVDSAT